MPPNENAPRPELVEEPRVALVCPDCGADLSLALAGQNVGHDCAIKHSLPGHRWLCQQRASNLATKATRGRSFRNKVRSLREVRGPLLSANSWVGQGRARTPVPSL
jgi:hypothetical protein